MHSAFDCIKVETEINTYSYISPTTFLIELYFQSTWTFKEDTDLNKHDILQIKRSKMYHNGYIPTN